MSNSTAIDMRLARLPARTAEGARARPTSARRLVRALALVAIGIAILGVPMALRLGLFALGHPHVRFVSEPTRSFQ